MLRLTNDPDHIIDISIKYESDPTLVYNWTIYDYPVTTFSPDDSTFWIGIIECVEGDIDNATIFEFSFDETDENCMTIAEGPAGQLFTEELELIVGPEYSNRFTYQMKVIEGHNYKLYENMDFRFSKNTVITWRTPVKLSALLTELLSLLPLPKTGQIICTVFGVIFTALEQIIPAASVTY